jgi:glycosyltransferase involved in cell wall biosynthesis
VTNPCQAPLRVAIVAPPWFHIPPAQSGGIEAVVADLASALEARGHDVVVIGAGAQAGVTAFRSTYSSPPSERLGEPLPELFHAAMSARIIDELDVDVVHDHSLAGPLTAHRHTAPTVVTCHHVPQAEYLRYIEQVDDVVHLVAVSGAQRRLAPHVRWTATIHNGIHVSSFPYCSEKGEHVLFLGRLVASKGPHVAIDVARKAGCRIVVAGAPEGCAGRTFVRTEIVPRLGPDVELVGPVGPVAKRELLARARCLLFPIGWEEPFGLVMAEAMACGTPVVALRRGSAPELVVDGVTGFVADDPTDLPAAVQAVGALRAQDCREHAARAFDRDVMAARYEQVYSDALAQRAADATRSWGRRWDEHRHRATG